jgi:hypothetical protein
MTCSCGCGMFIGDPRHARATGYRNGCRCPPCKRAMHVATAHRDHPAITVPSGQLLYILFSARMNSYKVGTSDRLQGRMNDIYTYVPDVELLAYCKGDFALERRVHIYLAEYHWRGEWFDLPKDIADHIIELITSSKIAREILW